MGRSIHYSPKLHKMDNERIKAHFGTMAHLKRKRKETMPDANGKIILTKNQVRTPKGYISKRSKGYNEYPLVLSADLGTLRHPISKDYVQVFKDCQHAGYEKVYCHKSEVVFDAYNKCMIPEMYAVKFYLRPFVTAQTNGKNEGNSIGAYCKHNELYSGTDQGGNENVAFGSLDVAQAMGYILVHTGTKRVKFDEGMGNLDRYFDSSDHVFSYHSKRRNPAQGAENERYTCGFEIEKEDAGVLREQDREELYDETGWILEGDSSLDGTGGFECISPILPLMRTNKLIQALEQVRDILGAGQSERCGGHIHLMDKERSQHALYDDICGYFPLLYALYPKRALNNYSKAYERVEMKNKGSHSVAVGLSGRGTVEIRLFPTPKNIVSQVWRVRLCQIMLTENCRNAFQLERMLMDNSSSLHKHLRLIYDTPEKLQAKFDMIRLFAHKIDGEKPRKLTTKGMKSCEVEKRRATKFIQARKAQKQA